LDELRQEVVRRRIQQRIAERVVAGPVRSDAASTLLSFAQERLLFLGRLEPSAHEAYQLSAAWRLQGALKVGVLQDAWNRLMYRHEPMRSRFVAVGDGFEAVIDEAAVSLESEEIAGEAGLAEWLSAQQAIVLDPVRGASVRAVLGRIDADTYVLWLSMHHAVSDGWSIGVICEELGRLYAAGADGRPDTLEPLPLRYRDYAYWERQSPTDGHVSFWAEHLRGAPPLLSLPLDRPRPAMQSFAGGRVELELPGPLTKSLQALSRRHGTTMFMTLLLGWSALLSRLCGEDEVVVGLPVSGRHHGPLEALVGFFANTLAVRVFLPAEATVAQALERMRSTMLEAYAHQEASFGAVVEAVQPARSLSHGPIFQAMFAFDNTPEKPLSLPGLGVTRLALEARGSQCDISLNLSERDGQLRGGIEYATSLFDRSTIERWARYLLRLLEGMAQDDGQPVDTLPLLDEAEREHLLRGFNDTERAVGPAVLIHRLFEEQARTHPDAVAVVCEDRQYTYDELNRRANRIAHWLRAQGAGPGKVIGVCVQRNLELPEVLLGVLKTGAAYLGLDGEYPIERLSLMIDDVAPLCVLTDHHYAASLPAGSPVLRVDDEEARKHLAVSSDADGVPMSEEGGDSLAYLIFTSGSTGRPKGVLVRHRGLSSLLGWAHETFSSEELSGVMFCTSICFDLSAFELFAPLTAGGTAIIVENALGLATTSAAERIRLVNTVPSAAASLHEEGGIPDSVITVALAGEALPRSLVQQLYARPSVRRVFNLYGPSETTTYSTAELVPEDIQGTPSIGKPVWNTQAYVLDRRGQFVPLGIAGELYIGGAGVAAGYLNREELTAERFLPNPFDAPGTRMYRTGDLVRWRQDGRLDYLGRIDHQVKLRGFRIELGEIEQVLAEDRSLGRVRVVVREDAPGLRQLVAYVVAAEGATVDVQALRAAAGSRLPKYMVPTAFVVMDAFPLGPTGKLDMAALPPPVGGSGEAFVEPSNPTEVLLCRMFAEVLGLPHVGTTDSFFDLGGHSLIVNRLLTKIQQTFGADLSIRDLFEYPTVAQLAVRLRSAGDARDPFAVMIPLRAGKKNGSLLFCFPPAIGFAWPYMGMTKQVPPAWSIYGLQSPALGDASGALPGSISEIAAGYMAHIREVQPFGPYHLLGWCVGACVAHEVACRLREVGEEVHFLANLDTLPAVPGVDRGADHERLVRYFFQVISVNLPEAMLNELDWTAIVATMNEQGHPFARLGVERIHRVFDVFLHHHGLMRDYRPERTFDGEMFFVRASDGSTDERDPAQEWAPYVMGGVSCVGMPGDHEHMLHPGFVEILSSLLADALPTHA
jgi:amino acid adenylation domain-containing protein